MLQELKGLVNKTQVEEKIIDARCEGESFSQMSGVDLRYCIDQIMLRGAAISGCPLPQTEFFAKYIAEELSTFINEFGYGELTYQEVLLAMRLNSGGGLKYPSGIELDQVSFTGSCFNVDYIAKVLANYKDIRLQLDRKFENQIDGY